MMDNQLINYLRLFHAVNAEDARLIDDAFQMQCFKESDYLFQSGHVCRQFFFVCKGILRIIVQNEKGSEVTHFFLKENQYCTILKSFNNETIASESIQAACDADVLAISKGKLLKLYEQVPYLKGIIDQITQQALLDKTSLRNSYLGLDSTARYRLFMSKQSDIALRVPLSDIASYLEITPQSLSRIRKDM